MSYCVHCGVKLSDAEKVCPLCGTEVIDVHRPLSCEVNPLFPDYKDTFTIINKKFMVMSMSIIMAIPVFVTIIVDLLVSPGLSWSLYLLGSILLAWTLIVIPKNICKNPYICIVCDVIMSLFLLLIINLLGDKGPWLWQLALPLCLSLGVLAMLVTFIMRRHGRRRLAKYAISGLLLCFYLVEIDALVHLFRINYFALSWSLYAAAPTVVLSVALLIVASVTPLYEWVRRNMFA